MNANCSGAPLGLLRARNFAYLAPLNPHPIMQRRKFLASATFGASVLMSRRMSAADAGTKSSARPSTTPLRYEEWLIARHKQVVPPAHIEAFLQPPPHNQWAKFDPELGYVPSDSVQRDGVDGSRTVYRYGAAGERRMINYGDRT